MAAATPYWDPADAITCHAEAAVTGKKLVMISGPRVDGNPQVSPATAGALVFGVAEHDAAIGEKVTVARVGIWPVVAGANLTAGAAVKSDGSAEAIAAVAGDLAAGVVLDDVVDGADAVVALHIHSVPV